MTADVSTPTPTDDHDHDCWCEHEPEMGWYLCNCGRRRRLDHGVTEAPGELIYQHPLCPSCRDETSHDDGFVCYSCNTYWPDERGSGRFVDDDQTDEQLAAQKREFVAGREARRS